ncbi:MAG: hypothetical protein HGB35_02440 [Geobacteraceae bacterium]|nr:hypothetical protein [Geobacteraceae bacterium]
MRCEAFIRLVLAEMPGVAAPSSCDRQEPLQTVFVGGFSRMVAEEGRGNVCC